VEIHGLGIVGVKGEIKGVGGASSTLISESTQAIRRAEEGELNVELFVVAGVEVDGLTAILVLTKFRKANRLGREIGGSLDSERHCVVCIIHLLGGLTLSPFNPCTHKYNTYYKVVIKVFTASKLTSVVVNVPVLGANSMT